MTRKQLIQLHEDLSNIYDMTIELYIAAGRIPCRNFIGHYLEARRSLRKAGVYDT